MSRWLANVNSLLEKLDGTVEEAIDEQRSNDQQGEDLDSILAKRGLSEENEVQFVVEDDGDHVESADPREEVQSEDHSSVVDVEGEESEGSNSTDAVVVESDMQLEKEMISSDETTEKSEEVSVSKTEDMSHINDLNDDNVPEPAESEGPQLADPPVNVAQAQDEQPVSTKKTEKLMPSKLVPRTPQLHITSLAPAPSSTASDADFKQALTESREAQKEARTLRRHVVALNKQLETAEAELDAQRFELEQAGDRLEKDRKKYKEEKEKLASKHVEEVKTLKKLHDQILADSRTLHQEEITKIQQQLKSAEEQRMQEGGDMTVELQNTLQREQELLRKMALME